MENVKSIVLFIPVRKGMMQEMKVFYGEILQFTINGSKFFVNNIETIHGQLQYSDINIDREKNPMFQYNFQGDFPKYCSSLLKQGVSFDFVAMTPGGYVAKIFDPCDNSILIGCDSFENSDNVDLSSWKEYRRY